MTSENVLEDSVASETVGMNGTGWGLLAGSPPKPGFMQTLPPPGTHI